MISVFKRSELKYLINNEQLEKLLEGINSHLKQDQYGRTSIQTIYYDTKSFYLIRESIERPVYKEKIRLRSYNLSTDGYGYLELKKKAYDTVYKRRIKIKEEDAISFIKGDIDLNNNQIEKEINAFRNHYKELEPKVLIIYERDSYYSDDLEFKITFDYNIRYRLDNLSLNHNLEGKKILDDNTILMEAKANGALPLWFVKILSENKIYKSSFSKYGTIYRNIKEDL